jgi:hypothetical protein
VVDRARQHPPELCRTEPALEVGDLTGDLGRDGLVLLRDAELEELLRVLDVPRELLGGLELLLDPGALSGDDLRLLGVVPEPRREGLLVQPFDFPLELRDVKDAPLAS